MQTKFEKQQPYARVKEYCDRLVERILGDDDIKMPKLNLLEESYVEAAIERQTGCTLPTNNVEWYTDVADIRAHFKK